MELAFFIGALVTGLVGSAHCLGMCGPLALMVHGFHSQKRWALVLYFLGKTLTYAALGAIAGSVGTGLISFGFTQVVSISLDMALLLLAINQLWQPQWWHNNIAAQKMQTFLATKTAKLLNNSKRGSSLFMGMLNGLLPCGLVYLGMIGSAATANAFQGAFYMMLMGIGTLPAMLVFVGGMHSATQLWRFRIQKIMPYMVAVVGLLLVLRGAGLGIPFISPAFASEAPNAAAIDCH